MRRRASHVARMQQSSLSCVERTSPVTCLSECARCSNSGARNIHCLARPLLAANHIHARTGVLIRSSAEFIAVLEVGRQPDGTLQGGLIAAAYHASLAAPVLLVLDRVSPAEVDTVLDDVVRSSPLNRPGVRYAHVEDDATVLAAAKQAHRIFASSDCFRAKLEARGLQYHDLTDLRCELAALIA